MHTLIVLSHPNSTSLTHAIAEQIAQGIGAASLDNTVEVADLAAEAFDPRFSTTDIAVHLKQAPPSADVRAEQARIDRADALVLVYPVYWWSMPGLLKGWIDRVFSNGWAYDEGPEIGSIKKLGRLDIHLVAVGGASLRTYAKHGYFGAMKMQIDHGIFGYCGARVITSELLLPSESEDLSAHLDAGRRIGFNIAGSIARNAA